MSFPKYSNYRHRGVKWLDQLPEHWNVKPLKHLIRKIESGTSVNASDEPAEGRIGVLKTSCVYSGEFDAAENKTVVEDDVHRVSCPLTTGTLIVSRMNTPELVGAAGIVTTAPAQLYLPDRLWQITFAGVDLRFVHFWTLSSYYRAQIQTACTGTSSSMKNLAQDQFLALVIPFPPVQEQKSIADFLRCETAKIEDLIAQQSRLIEMLKEKRQAVISHAVTKGLNPSAPTKPSGIGWLGDVPSHWAATRFSYLTRMIVDGTHFTPTYVEEGVPFLRVTDITAPTINLEDVKRIPQSEHENLRRRCEPERGDLLLSKNGTIGVPRVVDWDWEFSIFVSLCLIKLQPILDPYFASYVFRSSTIEMQIKEASKQSTVTNLHLEKIAAFKFPVPPIEEQRTIVSFLHRRTAELDELMVEAQRAIDLLEERRSGLISATVSGKIDVRGLAERATA